MAVRCRGRPMFQCLMYDSSYCNVEMVMCWRDVYSWSLVGSLNSVLSLAAYISKLLLKTSFSSQPCEALVLLVCLIQSAEFWKCVFKPPSPPFRESGMHTAFRPSRCPVYIYLESEKFFHFRVTKAWRWPDPTRSCIESSAGMCISPGDCFGLVGISRIEEVL